MRNINQAGIDLIKSFEGCRLTAYRDGGGILTVGYGHTGPDVTEELTIDQDAANKLLEADIARAVAGVNKLVTYKQVTDNEFSAMVCFAYNVGLGNFKKSTLLLFVNKFNVAGAANEFLRWDKIKGVISPGLERRRQAERALFLTV